MMFLVIMLFSYSVQAFHHHSGAAPDNIGAYKASLVEGDGSLHCGLCEQLAHPPSFDLPVALPGIAQLIPVVPDHGDRYYTGFYKFTLQGLSNKGPPFTSVA